MPPFDPQWNFTSILMSGFFFNFFKNIFSIDQKKVIEKKMKFFKFSKNRKFSKKKLMIFWKFENFDFWDFEKFLFSDFFNFLFSIDRKNIFWRSWEKIRTSMSNGNFIADRMGPLPASENLLNSEKIHSEKNISFFQLLEKAGHGSFKGPVPSLLKWFAPKSSKNRFFSIFIYHFRSEVYFRVVFRGWECPHSIRSEILLRYWCPDFFSTSSKIFFRSIKKKSSKKKWNFSNFQKIENFQRKNLWFFENLKISIFEISKNFYFQIFSTFCFRSIEKIFFEEVEKKSGHQCRMEISLRIEWDHSQPLKTS